MVLEKSHLCLVSISTGCCAVSSTECGTEEVPMSWQRSGSSDETSVISSWSRDRTVTVKHTFISGYADEDDDVILPMLKTRSCPAVFAQGSPRTRAVTANDEVNTEAREGCSVKCETTSRSSPLFEGMAEGRNPLLLVRDDSFVPQVPHGAGLWTSTIAQPAAVAYTAVSLPPLTAALPPPPAMPMLAALQPAALQFTLIGGIFLLPPIHATHTSLMSKPLEERRPELSVGSELHGTGECKPCAWFWRPQGCINGPECRHCHMCAPGEGKARRKSKLLHSHRMQAVDLPPDRQ